MTARRPHPTTERPLDAPLLTFDLPALLTQIKGEDTWHKSSRNAITLFKGQGLLAVRTLSPAAKELADRYFFEP